MKQTKRKNPDVLVYIVTQIQSAWYIHLSIISVSSVFTLSRYMRRALVVNPFMVDSYASSLIAWGRHGPQCHLKNIGV